MKKPLAMSLLLLLVTSLLSGCIIWPGYYDDGYYGGGHHDRGRHGGWHEDRHERY